MKDLSNALLLIQNMICAGWEYSVAWAGFPNLMRISWVLAIFNEQDSELASLRASKLACHHRAGSAATKAEMQTKSQSWYQADCHRNCANSKKKTQNQQ